MIKDFLRTSDHSFSTLDQIVSRAIEAKGNKSFESDLLLGKSIALVFFNPSLRTRASMQIGVFELGGNPVIVEPGGSSWTLEHRTGAIMDSDKTEHLKEFVNVLGRYVSAIGVRTFAELKDWELERQDPILNAFAEFSEKPVINLESAMHHPCQSMADMMTIREKLGSGKKKVLLTWAWHPKALPMAVPNSFALASAQFGHDLTIAHPKGYELDDDLLVSLDEFANSGGGSVTFSNDPVESFEGTEVVYAKSWGSKLNYGAPEAESAMKAGLRNDWIVNSEKMRRSDDALFMHCLPVRRNVIVTDEVIDSDRSVVIDEAENRLHVQKAIMEAMFR